MWYINLPTALDGADGEYCCCLGEAAKSFDGEGEMVGVVAERFPKIGQN